MKSSILVARLLDVLRVSNFTFPQVKTKRVLKYSSNTRDYQRTWKRALQLPRKRRSEIGNR